MSLNEVDVNISYGINKEKQTIPSMWSVKKLEEVSSFKQGYQIPFSQQVNEEKVGYVRYLYISDFFSDSKKLFVKDSEKYYKISPEDICVANTGNTGGKAFRGAKGILSNNMFKISIVPSEINNDFYWHFLNSNYYWNQLLRMFNSGGQPHVGHKNMGIIRIMLPPLNEQEKIASILSTWDKAIELKDELIKQKIELKKGLMQKLLIGEVRLPGFSSKWNKSKLKKLCTKIMDGTHSTPKYKDYGVPFYSVENVTNRDFKNHKFISREEHLSISSRCKVEKGDIIMTRIGSIGDAVLVDWDYESSIYVSLALLKTNENILAEYLVQYMATGEFKKDILSKSLLSAIPQKINLADIGNVKVYYPQDKQEQKAIVDILNKLDNEIQLLSSELENLKLQKKGLMQLLLTGMVRVKV